MIKQLKNILVSPLFIIVFISSLTVLVINYFTYQNGDFKYDNKYNITYSENIEDYDLEIDRLNQIINSMDKKMVNYNYYKNYYLDTIKIYEALKKENINYDKIYDFGYGNINDRIVYAKMSNSSLLLIITINVIAIVYLAFTREFDDSKYIFVYESSRMKKVINKILVSFFLVNVLFLLYYFINMTFSLKFDTKFQYVLMIGKDANIIKSSFYIFKYNFIFLLYNLCFLFVFMWTLAIFLKKSIYFGIGVLGIGLALTIIPGAKNLYSYVGLSSYFDVVPFEYYDVTKLAIIIPIIFIVFGVVHFEKTDL